MSFRLNVERPAMPFMTRTVHPSSVIKHIALDLLRGSEVVAVVAASWHNSATPSLHSAAALAEA